MNLVEPEVFESPKLIDSLPCRVYYGGKWLYQSWPEHREYIITKFRSWKNKEESEPEDDVQNTGKNLINSKIKYLTIYIYRIIDY